MKNITSIIEISSGNIKFLQAITGSEKTEILCASVLPFTSDDELVSGLSKLARDHKISDTKLVTVLLRSQVFVKVIAMPPGDHAETREMLRYEAERYLPFPLELAVMDFYHLDANRVCLVAAKRDVVDKHLSLLNAAGLLPERISFSSMALGGLASTLNRQDIFAFVLLDIHYWEIAVFDKNKLLLSRGFAVSADKSDSERLANIDKEITNSIAMLNSINGTAKINSIYYLCDSTMSDFIQKLGNLHKIPAEHFNMNNILSSALDNSIAASLEKYVAPIGLVLDSGVKIDLLPNEISDASARKKRNRFRLNIALAFVSGALVLFGLLFAIRYSSNSSNRETAKIIESNKREILVLAQIERKLDTIRRFNRDNKLSLEIIKNISSALPAGVYIRHFNYDYTENTVTIRGRAASFNAASKTVAQIGKSGYFSEVINKGSYAVKLGEIDVVDFEASAKLKSTVSTAL